MIVRQIQDQLVGEAMNHVVHVAHKIAVRLTHAKLLQMVPIIGTLNDFSLLLRDTNKPRI